ncbi:MAG TPA: hypothetical protein VGE41_04560, partial [Verrucomicrobiae bacterium]
RKKKSQTERDDDDPGYKVTPQEQADLDQYAPTVEQVKARNVTVVFEGQEQSLWDLKTALKLLDEEIEAKKADLQKLSPGTDSHNICYI